MTHWINMSRPGFFGNKKVAIMDSFDQGYGIGKWRLVWSFKKEMVNFLTACIKYYEASYYSYLCQNTKEIDFICSFGECIDNSITNIQSGTNYLAQEAHSNHIQDIAIRNCLQRFGRKFEGKSSNILEIRNEKSNGYRFNPGQIPFIMPEQITQPSLVPDWAQFGSVEDFWQSNKWVQAKIHKLIKVNAQ